MICTGDSTVAGYGDNDWRTAWPQQFARLLDTYYCPTQSQMTWGRQRASGANVDGRVTLGTGWSENNGPAQGIMATAVVSAAGHLSFALNATDYADTLDVYSATFSGNGTFVIRDGATSLGSVNTNGATGAAKQTFTMTRAQGKTINIDGPTVNGGSISAIEAYDATRPSIRVSPAGQSTTKITDWYTSGGPFPWYMHWLTSYAPHLTLVSLTINDSNASVAESTWEAACGTRIAAIKAAGSDVLLVAGPPSNTTQATNGTLESYRQGLYRLCDQYSGFSRTP